MAVALSKFLGPKERFMYAASKLQGLDGVDSVIRSKFISDATLLREIPLYLLELGGKRVRPVLTLLVAEACGVKDPPPALIDVAAGIELIHMATLMHDDIIDESPIRRHQSSALIKYGLPSTLLAGDFLLVRAFALCARLTPFIIQATEQACVELTEGEILETPLDKEKHTRESSLRIAQKKTASLFRLSCEVGSHLADLPDDAVKAFGEFGEELGIAFQIVDDILDVLSTEEQLGKQPGTDIRERKPSLVNVLWLESGSERATKLLTSAEKPSVEDIESALTELKGSAVLEEAKQIAIQRANRARESLRRGLSAVTHPSPLSCDALEALIEYCTSRME